MKRSTSIIAAVTVGLLTAAASGCVSSKDYEAIKADLAKARSELTDTRGELKDLGVALEEAEVEVDILGARIRDLEEQLVIAEARASDAETQLAEVLKDRSNLAASVDDMQQALAELKRLQALAELRANEYRAVLAKFKSLIDNGKLKAKIVDGRMVLELQTDILFGSGSAKLSDEGAATIREVGGLLGQIADRKFQVEGHTDNVPIKTKTYPSNWELASARAINVVKEMVDAGLPAKRVSAGAFADSRPTASNETEEGRAQNRRIEIVIVPDLSSLPGAEQIEEMFNAPGA
ncbi:putative lipoprotein YiaD precursor [Enhygromyxa salina]|uniref:Putative lipoprotein YiaD n=1 Tax=Enhygromyxa salina TaxID=215803 RepID=A0A2S9XRG0_9BACT|nr:flagellar motor protein MotB [Enhygromyxa salina]PRP95445.1 putative lipoprotein YiaD precursor [Enhygromyxa salina]